MHRDILIHQLQECVGPANVLTNKDDLAPFLEEQRGKYKSSANIAIAPATTKELAMAIKLCGQAWFNIIPVGGNTGLVGGTVSAAGDALISLKRMNRIRQLDAPAHTMTVEAGCILADIQKAAADAELLFPLSLGAEGSCQIGGNLASNAGGVNVLRYGNARELCLGLEVVLPDGRIWNGLKGLAKDNAGYALKHLFIGAEGTLGIITAATLKLFPRPTDSATALLAVPDLERALWLLGRARALSGDSVSAFEVMNHFSLTLAAENVPGNRFPLEDASPWYALIELSTSRPDAPLRPVLENLLEEAVEKEAVTNGVIAESGAQADALWRLRETIPEAQKPAGGSIKHDISLPLVTIPSFVEVALAAAEQLIPGIRPCTFGHLGDGNLHFNFSQPTDMPKETFLGKWEALNQLVHDLVNERDGSISAEHGIGLLKRDELKRLKSPVEINLMERLKNTLDPHNIMNPGKVVKP